MAEEQIDWSTAPAALRAAHEANTARLRELEAESAASKARLTQIDRREKFAELKSSLGDVAKDVTLEDLGDLPLDQFTPTTLEVKALEKTRARVAAEERQAKELGYENREAFVADLTRVREEREKRTATQTQVANLATGGPGTPEPPKAAVTLAMEVLAADKAAGRPADVQGANFLNALLAAKEAEALAGAKA